MSKYVDMIGWDDCPHLQPPNISKEELDEMEKNVRPHQREARRKGRPSLGAGAIYPVLEDDIFIDPFEIPKHWPRGYGMDVGWRKTAGIWGAVDREPELPIVYLYSEYYVGEALPALHAVSFKSRGSWIRGAFDHAGNRSNERDGRKLRREYEDLGLKLVSANKGVEAGLFHVLTLMQSGRLKIFNSLVNTKREFRLYRRDEKGKIVKENDHLMDAMRYLLFTKGVFSIKPVSSQSTGRRRGEF